MSERKVGDHLIFRFHDKGRNIGKLDEIVLLDKDGECILHLEQMDHDSFFMGIYPSANVPFPLHSVQVYFRAKSDMSVTAIENKE